MNKLYFQICGFQILQAVELYTMALKIIRFSCGERASANAFLRYLFIVVVVTNIILLPLYLRMEIRIVHR